MEQLTSVEEMIMKCIWNYGKEMPFLQLGKELKEKYDTQRKTENTDSQTHRKQTVKQINLLLYLLHLPVLLWQY